MSREYYFRRLFLNIIIMITMSGVLISCKSKTDMLKTEVNRLAAKINHAFVIARKNTILRKEIMQKAYENKDKYDLSTNGMDVSEGGAYTWFEDYLYYAVKDKFNGKGMINILGSKKGLFLDPKYEYKPENLDKVRKLKKGTPEFLKAKREMRLWEHILVEFMNAGERPEYTEFVYCCNPRIWLHMYSMYYDYASVITPNFTQKFFMSLEWVKNGAPFGNPGGKAVWTKDAFVSLSGEGWIQNISVPVYANGKYVCLVNNNFYPIEIAKKDFRKNKYMVVFLSSGSSLLGASNSAKKLLEVKEITDFRYLEQPEIQPFVAGQFKLTHKNQKSYTRQIGAKVLAGEKHFEVKIEDKTYTVIVGDIPEIKFYVVGLVEK